MLHNKGEVKVLSHTVAFSVLKEAKDNQCVLFPCLRFVALPACDVSVLIQGHPSSLENSEGLGMWQIM